jgi:hypothetical protein
VGVLLDKGEDVGGGARCPHSLQGQSPPSPDVGTAWTSTLM